jgi:hypothetical protein
LASNSQQASINSRPLFIMLAESTEILRPMDQFGCAQACSGETCAALNGVWRKGPPEAVSKIRRTPTALRPRAKSCGMHWKIALCSLSIGSSTEPLLRTACMNSAPDITSASLLASRIFLPASTAASVGRRPAAPTMAAITASTSGAEAT